MHFNKKKSWLIIGLILFNIISIVCFYLFRVPNETKSVYNSNYKKINPIDVSGKLDAFFTKQEKNKKFSGAVLVAKNGKILLRKGYGYADFDSKIKNMPEHIFTIGSMTKSFVAASIMLLQERGKLNVNDTIEKYIPTYKYANKITIHQLLTHTSGVHCFLKNNDPEFFKNMDKYHTEEEVFDYFKNYELDFEPGSQYSYSNAGYILLGFIIERVAKQPFKDFVKENIFDVVGMRDTFYDETDIINKDRMATGYNLPLSNHTVARNLHVSITYTSGGIRSTVDDMYKWDQCLYNNSVLSPQSLRAIFTPYKNNYGYGWWIDSLNIQGKQFKQIWHWGCTMGYHGIISRLTDEKTTLIILQNTTSPNLDSPENPESLLKLRDGVFNIIFGN